MPAGRWFLWWTNYHPTKKSVLLGASLGLCKHTRKPGRSPTRQYGVLRPFLTCAPSLDFFWVFQEDFSSCNSESSQSRASGWKALDGLTAQCSFGTSLTILFQSCEHRKKSWTTMQPCSCQNLDFFLFWRSSKTTNIIHSPQSTLDGPESSTLTTGYITCLGMCKVCTEAVHSVAL